MSLIAKDKGGDFVLVPEGTYVARCDQVIDLGVQFNPQYGSKEKIYIRWELPEELFDDGRPMVMGQTYTLSLNKNSNLRKMLESWRGKAFDENELKQGFDTALLLGKSCLLTITHTKKSTGEIYANVVNVSKLPKNLICPNAINQPLRFSLDDFDEKVFQSLSERLRKKINPSAITHSPSITSGQVDPFYADDANSGQTLII